MNGGDFIKTFIIIDGKKGRINVTAKTLKSALNQIYGRKLIALKSFRPQYINIVKASKDGGYDWLASVPAGQKPLGFKEVYNPKEDMP